MILQELNVRMGLIIDEFEKNAEKTKKQADSIESKFKLLKSALLGLGVFVFLKDAVASFMEAERVSDILGDSIKRLGGDFVSIQREVSAFADSMSELAGINDEELKVSLTDLIDITHDTETSMSLLQDAMDLHIKKGLDMKRATELVGRAFAGEQGELAELGKMFGISQENAKSFEVVMKEVRNQVGGAAASTDDLTQKIGSISSAFGDLKEQVGEMTATGGIWSNMVSGLIGATTKMLKVFNSFQDALRASWKNVGSIFKKGFKTVQDDAKIIFQEFIDETVRVFEAGENKKTEVARTTKGKQRQLTQKELDAEKAAHRKAEMDKIKITEAAMKNRVLMGKSTLDEFTALHAENTEQIKSLYGELSLEYQTRLTEQVALTQESMKAQQESMGAFFSSMSSGFEALFIAMREEGATAATVMEAFARAMGRSFLGAIATAIEAEAAKGLAGYLANMLGAGPIGAGPVTAYSLPMIGILSGLAGGVRGLSAALAEGGIATGPVNALIGERRDRVPEIVTPLNRMDDVFERWRDTMGGGRRGGDQGGITIRVDARGSHHMDSGFSEGRIAKKISDALYRRQLIKRT